MKEMKMPVQKFDVEGFVTDILKFLKSQEIGGDEPDVVIAEVEEDGSTPDWGESIPNRNIIRELLEEEKALFFTFSNTNSGEPIPCADGKTYQIDYDEEDCDEVDEGNEETDEAEEEEDDSAEYSLGLGEGEVVGYVLKVSQGELSIQTVVHGPGMMCFDAPSVEEIEDAGPFEQGMTEYLKRFIRD